MGPRLLVAAAAAVLTYLAMWALLFVVDLLRATYGSSRNLYVLSPGPSLLPPNSWPLRAVYLDFAILVGLLTFRASREWRLSFLLAAVPAGLALTAVLLVSTKMHAASVQHEHNYLRHLPPGMSREAGLAYGHQACDWLAAQPWGRHPGPDYLPRAREAATSRLVYRPRTLPWGGTRSSNVWMVYYLDHLDAQHPGPLTLNERQQASVTADAWYELCPFQPWVHRPVGGHG